MLQITLKAARVNADLTIKEVSELSHISIDILRNYESGRTAIPAYALNRLAKIYGVSSEHIRLPIVNDGEFDEEEKNLKRCTV